MKHNDKDIVQAIESIVLTKEEKSLSRKALLTFMEQRPVKHTGNGGTLMQVMSGSQNEPLME